MRSVRPGIALASRPSTYSRPIGRGWRWASSRQWSTPLAGHLAEMISAQGPIPVAAYMRQCLTSPDGGYYASDRQQGDQFGQKGDFITSPEISQIFGELVAIWVVAEWMAQGKPTSHVDLIEVGPGRGTLMDDMLRTIRRFGDLASAIEHIYLVEASPVLRESQRQLLCGDVPVEETSTGYRSRSKHLNIPVVWEEHLRFIPKGAKSTPFIVAHEFFDALPIHVFQSLGARPETITTDTRPSSWSSSISKRSSTTGSPWRELLVGSIQGSRPQTNVAQATSHVPKHDLPEFELTLAKEPTPYSMFLPGLSPRYQALEGQAGAIIEVSPDARSYAEEFARRIGGGLTSSDAKTTASGAALIIDYGPSSTVPINSLRGIRAHGRVSPFSSAGLVDLSVDVDFTALAEAALSASSHVEVHGPVDQHDFLLAMGIRERAQQLLRRPDATSDPDKAKRIDSGWKRLIDRAPGGMGKLYKAMTIVPMSHGRRRPVGFGGDVVS